MTHSQAPAAAAAGDEALAIDRNLSGKRILLTGATGFLGKVVLEKILREVPGIAGVVLLIRGTTRRPTAAARFEAEIQPAGIFDRLRRERSGSFQVFCRERIECVTGDVTARHFGLGPEGFGRLARRVDAVVHAAASVDFRDELPRALEINARSLLHVAEFVRTGGGLPLVHVSTCYVNGHGTGLCREEAALPAASRDRIRPTAAGVYDTEPLLVELDAAIQQEARRGSGDTHAARMIELGVRESRRRGWNDTYTFTKWIGEQLLRAALPGGTLTILRPAIIESTYDDPVPGWLEGVKVADAVILAYARGLAPFLPGRPRGVLDLVPADFVANAAILGLAEALAAPGLHRIYQCATGGRNPLTLDRMRGLLQTELNRCHAAYPRLLPRGRPPRDMRILHPWLFAALFGGLRVLQRLRSALGATRRTRRMAARLATIVNLAETFSFYMQPRCVYDSSRLLALAARLTPADQARFPVDARLIDWERYMGPIQLGGLDRHVLRDRPEQTPAAAARVAERRRARR